MPEPASPRIAVLVSGRGRNLQSLLDACADGRIPGRVTGVVSSRKDAQALARARRAGCATQVVEPAAFADRAGFDAALRNTVDALQPDLVLLAGYMRILDAAFVAHFAGRLLNIHPSLLPKYPGLHTHRRALEAGDAAHGATVHFVTAELDGGPPIIQGVVSVRADDDETALAERVMQDVECRIFPQAAAWFCRGLLRESEGCAWFGDRRLSTPLGLADLDPEFR